MENSIEGAQSPAKDELFGPPPPRRPIPSHSFSTLVRIFSIFPQQNPFSRYASYANVPEYLRSYPDNLNNLRRRKSDDSHDNAVASKGVEEASTELVSSAAGVVHKSFIHDEASNKAIAADLCGSVGFDGSQLIVNEFSRVNEDKATGKNPSNEKVSVIRMRDVLDNNFPTMENRKDEKLTFDGFLHGDVTNEKKLNGVEENRSTSVSDKAKFQNPSSSVKEKADCLEVLNHHVGPCSEKDQRKLCKEEVPLGSSKHGGLTFAAQKCKSKAGTALNSSTKDNMSGTATKGKTKKVMATSVKDMDSGPNKLSLVDGGTSNNMKSCGGVSVMCGSIAGQKVCGDTGITSVRKGGIKRKSCQRIQYSRKELLNIRKMTSITGDMSKAVQEIDAVLFCKDQNAAAGKMIGERLGFSEAKKEKKKRQKKKKRAEMNKKLGVKRLKLEPVSKPKVTQVCRHFLIGRCQEGDKCKFSHDAIPLTKSKPCSHFARQGCMKGDDCPYDHQLSNYSCNSYVTSGFCIRGDSCFFSHKVTPTTEQLDKSNTKQPLNANASFSSDFVTPKNLQEDISKLTSHPAKAQKGLSFLSPDKLSVENFDKHKQSNTTQKSSHPGADGPSNMATTSSAVNIIKASIDNPHSNASQKLGYVSAMKASEGSSEHHKPSRTSFHWVNSTLAPHNNEKGSSYVFDNTTQHKLGDSPASSGQCSIKGGLKNTPKIAQKALLSTLEFAAKFESGIRMTSATPKITRNEPCQGS